MGRLAGIVFVTAILATVAPDRFGGDEAGPLRWDGAPRTSAMAGTPGDRLLFGHVVNRSDEVQRLRAAEVRVVDGDGDRLQASAAFADGFVPAVSLRGYGAELYAADGAVADVGGDVTLKPGQAAPLSVSFTVPDGAATPAAIVYGEGRLTLE
jgi:hypothetical protein